MKKSIIEIVKVVLLASPVIIIVIAFLLELPFNYPKNQVNKNVRPPKYIAPPMVINASEDTTYPQTRTDTLYKQIISRINNRSDIMRVDKQIIVAEMEALTIAAGLLHENYQLFDSSERSQIDLMDKDIHKSSKLINQHNKLTREQ